MPGRLADSRPASLVRVRSRETVQSSPRAWSRTVASSTSSGLPSLAGPVSGAWPTRWARRLRFAIPSGSVISHYQSCREIAQFEPYVANFAPLGPRWVAGQKSVVSRRTCGAAARGGAAAQLDQAVTRVAVTA